jgi:hypothetical protein
VPNSLDYLTLVVRILEPCMVSSMPWWFETRIYADAYLEHEVDGHITMRHHFHSKVAV